MVAREVPKEVPAGAIRQEGCRHPFAAALYFKKHKTRPKPPSQTQADLASSWLNGEADYLYKSLQDAFQGRGDEAKRFSSPIPWFTLRRFGRHLFPGPFDQIQAGET